MDLGLYSLYSNLIDIKVRFCSLCFKIVSEDAGCIQDTVILGLDEDDAECSSSEEMDIQQILQDILGDKTAAYLSENDTICNKCTRSAISSYKFIKTCKRNMKSMATAVELFTTVIGNPNTDFGDQKTLFLSMNFHDSMCIRYFDTIKFETNKSALSRFQSLFRPFKVVTDNEGNNKYHCTKCPTSYPKETRACEHFTSEHIEDPDINEEASEHIEDPDINEESSEHIEDPDINEEASEHIEDPDINKESSEHIEDPDINEEASEHIEDPDINEEVQNIDTVSEEQSPINVGKSYMKNNKEKTHTVKKDFDKYKCIKCPTVFTKAVNARRHYQLAHAQIKKSSKRLRTREMSKDYIRYLNEVSYVKITDVDGTSKYQCTECVTICSNTANARRHFETTHMEEDDILVSSKEVNHKTMSLEPTCIFCNENFENKYVLTKHILKEHSIEPVQDITGIEADKEVFKYAYTVVQNENGCEKCQCKVCGKLFKNHYIITTHFIRQHLKVRETDQQFICSHCGKEYNDTSALKRHEEHHTLMTCPTCNKVYKSRTCFKQHICFKETARSDMQRDVICHYCGKTFVSKNSLRIHIRYHHDPQSQRYKCQHCPKTFGALSIWKAHQIKHTSERNFTCDICNNVFATQTSLIHHKRIHTGERPFGCKFCDMRFLSNSRRTGHVKRHHIAAAMATCDICGDMVRADGMYKHKRRHNNENSTLYIGKEFETTQMKEDDTFVSVKEITQKTMSRKPPTCIFCKKNYENKYVLAKHILEEHSIEADRDITGIEADKKVFNYVYTVVKDENECEKCRCKVCGKLFKSHNVVTTHFKRLHLQVHRTDQQFICSHCGKECKDPSDLKRHEEHHTLRMTCPTCNKVYKSKVGFKQHICFRETERSFMERNVICDYCGNNFVSKASLRIHIRNHHDPQSQRYKCHHCPKAFAALSLWKAHQITHTKEKNFNCDICGNVYATQMALVHHRRIHTGERPYDCKYCDMKFVSSSRRANHVTRHHIAAMVTCEICGATVRADGLYRHKRRHNNENSTLYKKGGSAKKGRGSKKSVKKKKTNQQQQLTFDFDSE